MRQVVLAALVSVVVFSAGCSESKPDCMGDAVVCAGSCADLGSDNLNCGACGNACEAGKVCSSGACALTCQAGLVNCGGSCIDPATDRTHCGASGACTGAQAGVACASGEVCAAGVCDTSCPVGQVDCNARCVDPLTDRLHCGASGDCAGANAGASCAAGEVCAGGACGLSCQAGLVNCGGKCVDPMTDRAYCGASGDCAGVNDGTVCGAGEVCSAGTCALSCQAGRTDCAGQCVDLTSDNRNCGGCERACAAGQVCSSGACQLSCQAGLVNCGGKCVDPMTDRAYCGASGDCTGANDGTVCASGEICSGGTCALSCQPGLVQCAGQCVDPQNDPRYCGAIDACEGAQTCAPGFACSAGTCALSCQVGLVDCSGKCVDPQTDRAFCGVDAACGGGEVCASGYVCSAGACRQTCPVGEYACGGRCIDPQSDPSYCGAAADCSGGTVCAVGYACYQGACALLLECAWHEAAFHDLASAPPGSVQKGGGLGAQGPAVVGGRTAWLQASDWNILFVPTSLGEADDVFAFEAEVYWPGVSGINHEALLDAFVTTDTSIPYQQTGGVVSELLEGPPGTVNHHWHAWNGASYTSYPPSAAGYPVSDWRTYRVEGQRSTCRFRALYGGVELSRWSGTCDLGGGYFGLHAGDKQVQPVNMAWSNLRIYTGSAPSCVP